MATVVVVVGGRVVVVGGGGGAVVVVGGAFGSGLVVVLVLVVILLCVVLGEADGERPPEQPAVTTLAARASAMKPTRRTLTFPSRAEVDVRLRRCLFI
jgi:hypothetical protein